MEKILLKLFKENKLSSNELLKLLNNKRPSDEALLYKYARQTKEAVYGKDVFMRGLIEFSNHCSKNCLYCGLRRDNMMVSRYRLNSEDIMSSCEEGYKVGYRTFVLQSGEDSYYDIDLLSNMVKEIKERFKGVAVTLSIGEKSEEEYEKLFSAGVDRFLLRHETSNVELYEKLHPHMKFESRKRCLKTLRKVGYQIGAGFMVGLPGEKNEDLVENLLFLKNMQPHMVGIGPFIPHPQTPLGGEKGGTVEKTLKMLALTRLLLPQVLLPATTAMETLDPKGKEKALQAGANVIMSNLSPINAKENYEIYQGKSYTKEEAKQSFVNIENRIKSIGLKVDLSRGDHINWRDNK